MATKKNLPEYHKALMEREHYPSATRRIKFEETPYSYLYRTGTFVYKIRKPGPLYPNLAIKERLAHESLRLGQRWAPEVVQAVVPVVRTEDGSHAVESPGTPVDYALKLVQLPDNNWLHRLIPAGRMTPTGWGRLARFLAEHHAAAPVESREAARPDQLRQLLDEVFYQAKKYMDLTLSQPMLEMATRPVYRFLDDERKLLVRRQKKGRVVDGHGAFVPHHIYVRSTTLHAVAPLEVQAKFRVLDAANDVATLTMELYRLGEEEAAELFVKRYVAASKDRDLPRLLPAYTALQAMRAGVWHSERVAEHKEDEARRRELGEQARAYFNLAVQAARRVPREAPAARQA